jgi:hypothetical protein
MNTHNFSKPVDTMPPKVCAVIVHHRGPTHEWLLQALESLNEQSYHNLECITIDNAEKPVSIGEARNQAVAATDADLVLFLGEEDMLTPDTIQAMVGLYQVGKRSIAGLLHITTGCMLWSEDGARKHSTLKAPGLYERNWLAEHPFEKQDRPDQAIERAMEQLGRLHGVPVTFGCTHHFGYILRVHPFRRDGINIRA